MNELPERLPTASPAALPLPARVRHGVGSYTAGAVIGPAEWPHHDLIVLTRGSATFEVRGTTLTAQSGDALLLPPNHAFVGRAGADGCGIWVQHFVYPPGVRPPHEGSKPGPWVWRGAGDNEWSRSLMQRLRALQVERFEESRPSDPPELAHLLALLVESLRQSADQASTWISPAATRVQRAIAWARSRASSTADIDVETLAAKADLSPSQFRTLFRQIAGTTAGKFLRDLRLGEAARLLQETRLPIKDISARLGYSDPVAFHRAFQLKTGTTPARFRAGAERVV